MNAHDFDDTDVYFDPEGNELTKNLKELNPEVFSSLRNKFRTMKYDRDFQPEMYLSKKVIAINEFFHHNSLDCAILGVSGGVDSSLVLSLLIEAASATDSPIKKIVALSMPIHCNGTTGQEIATDKAKLLVDSYYSPTTTYKKAVSDFLEKNPSLLEYKVCDLTTSFIEYTKHAGTDKKSAWANGQMASVLRTPMLYYQAAIYQEKGYKSIVVGTINRDEGSYIGFFGKASDAMVDLQPIADIHKSEVYSLSKMLEIPKQIIDDKPRGDVWDNKIDEEMIGAPYWFLELYIYLKNRRDLLTFQHYSLPPEHKELCASYIENIEKIHTKNAHKYKVGMPSHFIDVMPRAVVDGWK